MSDKGKVAGLDGLRGAAAICIVALHTNRLMGDIEPPFAALAVDLFFLLSGFVLAHNYSDRFVAGLSPTRFMVTRWIRLYPMYSSVYCAGQILRRDDL